MARILFDFQCPNQEHPVFEELSDTNSGDPVLCPQCFLISTRQLSAGRIDPKLGLDATSYPTMGDKWAKMRTQRQKIEAKKARDHGPEWR